MPDEIKNPETEKNKAEDFVTMPVRTSVALVALALMFSLVINGLVSGVYALENYYLAIIENQNNQLAAVAAAAKANKPEPVKANDVPKETSQIIVKYKEDKLPPGLTVAAAHANLEKAQGLVKVLTINGIDAVVYTVSEDDSAQEVVDRLLAQDKGKGMIEYAEVDMLIPLTYTPNDPNLGNAWHIPKTSTNQAWDIVQGEGVIVAIADTGVDCTHSDLAASCVPGWNTVSNNSDTTDINNHGTWVAGTAAEIGDNGVGSAGVAYKAKIMPMRVTNQTDGWAQFSAIAAAFTWAADNGAKVAQASYSGCGSASIINAGAYMRSKGGVATVSAGNTGADGGFGTSDNLVCVSATDSSDNRTSWSSFGAYVDVSAPGASIYTTARGGGYSYVSGTSFSGPLTTGIYALMFSANPALTPTQADSILFSTADDLGAPGWDMYYGHGRVNAGKAVAAALAAVGTRDIVPPSVPTNLRTINVTTNSVLLAWNASTDDNSGVAGYTIYRDGAKLATVAGTSYTNSGLTAATSYSYTVTAEDVAGNVSAATTPLSVSTPDISFGITSYSVSQKTNTTATIATILTKPGTVTIKYGTTNTNLNLQAPVTGTDTNHSVSLSSLTANTTYYYQVTATDGTTTVTSAVSSFKTSKGGGGGGGGGKPPKR